VFGLAKGASAQKALRRRVGGASAVRVSQRSPRDLGHRRVAVIARSLYPLFRPNRHRDRQARSKTVTLLQPPVPLARSPSLKIALPGLVLATLDHHWLELAPARKWER